MVVKVGAIEGCGSPLAKAGRCGGWDLGKEGVDGCVVSVVVLRKLVAKEVEVWEILPKFGW
jgi:hypothetical protein